MCRPKKEPKVAHHNTTGGIYLRLDIRERVRTSCLLSLAFQRYLKTFELSVLLTEIVSGKGKRRRSNEVDGLRALSLFSPRCRSW